MVCLLLSFVGVLLPKASLSLTLSPLRHTLNAFLIFAFSLWHILFPFSGKLFPWFSFQLTSSFKTWLKSFPLWLPPHKPQVVLRTLISVLP